MSSSQIGSPSLATTFVNPTQLSALVPASILASPQRLLIGVVNPGGAVSNAYGPPFIIYPPGVTIASLNPITVAAGYPFPSLTLSVNGSGFQSGAIVQWNGFALPTNFVSSTRLTASVPAALLASAGAGTVTVLVGGIVSNSANFTIGPPDPVVTSLNPSSATAGSAGFTLTISGTGFLPGATVQINGSVLATTFVNAEQVTALVPASIIGSPGYVLGEVVNPGGAASGLFPFKVNPQTRLSILTTSPLPSGAVGTPYSLALAATGGVAPYKDWTVAGGVLPPGLSLITLNGVLTGLLSGVPTATGTFAFTAQVTDSLNATAMAQFSVTINPGGPSIAANGVLNAASYVGGGVAPGEMLTIFGSGLGPDALAGLQLDSRGDVSTALAGTQVLFDGTPAPLIYSLAGQVSAMAPYAINGKSSTQVQVVFQGQASNTVSVPVVSAMPGIFTLDSSGSGPGAIVNQDGTVNSANNPAPAGSIVFIYATGEGQSNPGGIDGKPGDYPAPTPVAQPVTATLGDLNAPVLYAGGVPGMIAGFLQVNIQVPSDVSAGNTVPVVLTIGGKTTQANVTLAVGPPAR
jgi:uncharacterized protein (TIGR03437 family)